MHYGVIIIIIIIISINVLKWFFQENLDFFATR